MGKEALHGGLLKMVDPLLDGFRGKTKGTQSFEECPSLRNPHILGPMPAAGIGQYHFGQDGSELSGNPVMGAAGHLSKFGDKGGGASCQVV